MDENVSTETAWSLRVCGHYTELKLVMVSASGVLCSVGLRLYCTASSDFDRKYPGCMSKRLSPGQGLRRIERTRSDVVSVSVARVVYVRFLSPLWSQVHGASHPNAVFTLHIFTLVPSDSCNRGARIEWFSRLLKTTQHASKMVNASPHVSI